MNVLHCSNHRLYCLILRPLIAIILGLLLITCGGGSSPTDQGGSNNTQQSGTTDFLASKVIGFVMDENGELISYASLGGASTGSVGVTTNEAVPTASGWYEVRAEGYATSYTRVSGKIDGINVLSTSLTAVDTKAFHPAGVDDTEVVVGDSAAPVLMANFTASTFDVDAVIELTALNPAILDNTFASMDTSDDLFIHYPFDITAYSASDGSALQPASGQVVQVTLTDNGVLGDPPRLFWFDPELGMWLEQHGAGCDRVDANKVSCQLSHFSQHAGGGSNPPPAANSGSRYANAKNATNYAYARRAHEMAIAQVLGAEEVPCEIFNDELLDAFMEEIDAAMQYAKDHPSEKAKAQLADTAARLNSLGIEGGGLEGNTCDDVFADNRPDFLPNFSNPAAALKKEMEVVTDKLADQLLENPQCPDIPAIDKIMAEAQLLLMNETNNRLQPVYEDLLNKCNIWEGQITYSIILPRAMASYPEYNIIMSPWFGGALNWAEFHDFTLILHASSLTEKDEFGSFEGTDKVTTNFPQVEYREFTDQAPCSFPVYQSDFRSGQPNLGKIEASFTGDFDKTNGFVPDGFTAPNNININWRYFETGWAFEGETSPVCVKTEDGESSGSDPYRGQLVEQYADDQYYNGDSATPGTYAFENFSYQKLPSVWDILNRGPTKPAPPATEADPFPKAYYTGSEILLDAYSFGLMDGMQIIMRWEIVNTDYTKGR